MRQKAARAADTLGEQSGFSMIEMLIVMTLFVIILGITVNTSTLIFNQSAQQAKGAEAQMESVVGLEMLRRDLEQAGYGLPWSFQSTITYNEASVSPASNYNDSTGGVPRAVAGGTGLTTFVLNNSDYLAIKSAIAGMDSASQRMSYLLDASTVKKWGITSEDLADTDNVIIIRPQASETILKQLVMNGTNFYTSFNTVTGFPVQAADLIYGISSSNAPRMPFNRADYYVRRPASGTPSLCNSSTGVLYKATVNQGSGAGGGQLTEYPLLDCVASMYVVLNLDMNDDGTPGTFSSLPDATTGFPNVSSPSEGATASTVQATLGNPELLRKRLKEVRVYLLAQTGQIDTSYIYPSTTVALGAGTGIPVNFNLSAKIGSNWQNYRWKVYTLVVKPKSLY
ncbi:MAG TPA: prepilin-type N-terminal cleavage/methylation domain-containing protein [Dissulfurispiraceae bacterium]